MSFQPAEGPAPPHVGSDVCLNCAAPLTTPYCGYCGQHAQVHATLRSIGHDLLHGLFHFEGKIWRTIIELTLRPGLLTRRYIAGDRAKFVSPLALFLFAVFLMFVAFELSGGPFHPDMNVSLQQASAQTQAHDAPTKTDLSELIATLADTGSPKLDHQIVAAAANPALLVLKLQENAHKLAWLLIPTSVPFLWLVFVWKRGFGVYDHTVFIIYALTAVMLLLALMALLSGLGISAGWVLLLIPVH